MALLGQTGLTVVTCPEAVPSERCTGSPTSGVVGGLDLFVDWYPTARGGFHLGGGIGIARTTLRTGTDLIPDRDSYGPMLYLATGYDFWLNDFLALGPFLRFIGYRAQNLGVVTSGGAITLGASLVYQ
jgi:hypothetical protein